MAAALLSSLVSIRRTFIRSFTSPNRLLIRISPRNSGRRISCSAADPQISPLNLGSTQPCRISFGSRAPVLLHADRKMKTLIKSGQRAMELQQTINKSQIEKKLFHAGQHPPAMVLCATVEDDVDDDVEDYEKIDVVTLHFSTFHPDGELLKQFTPPPLQLHKPYVLSACRNLLLLRSRYAAVLCNIATQELIHFSDIEAWVMGFGYLPSTKKFKLLTINLYKLGSNNNFKVFTLGNKRWRDVEKAPLDINPDGDAALVNGTLHFRSSIPDNKIVSFNLEREEWGLIAPPPIQLTPYRLLKELNGYLCIVDNKPINNIDIWLLDHYNLWTKASTISLSAWDEESILGVVPLSIEKDGRILVQVQMLNMFSLQFYDPKAKSTREIFRFHTPDGCRELYFKVSRPWSIGKI